MPSRRNTWVLYMPASNPRLEFAPIPPVKKWSCIRRLSIVARSLRAHGHKHMLTPQAKPGRLLIDDLCFAESHGKLPSDLMAYSHRYVDACRTWMVRYMHIIAYAGRNPRRALSYRVANEAIRSCLPASANASSPARRPGGCKWLSVIVALPLIYVSRRRLKSLCTADH
jgi:hypothetical protein